jgi:hypothetical protein
MRIDDLVARIRRLPSAKRKKLDEMVRSLEESPQEAAASTTGEQATPSGALRPVRGLLRGLGPAPSDEAMEEARRELWGGFPREDLP